MGIVQYAIDHLPVLQSYRGRYLLLSFVMALALLSSGLIGYHYVTDISDRQLSLIQQRSAATALTHDSLEQLNKLKNQIYQLLINPPLIEGDAVILSASHLRNAIQRLQASQWLKDQMNLGQLVEQISEDTFQLERHVMQLAELRQHRDRWFPALGAIEQQMLPANKAAHNLIKEMIEEAGENHAGNPGWQIHQHLIQLQNNWLNATSELRLLIANRFGIFSSDPLSGIAGRASNIYAYVAEIYAKLDTLEGYRRQGQLGFIATAELDKLRTQIDSWARSFDVALQQISEPEWRADIEYLHQFITPLLNHSLQRLTGIRLELDVQSARDITDLTGLSTNLAQFIVLLAVLGSAFLITTYFMFSRLVLTPIRQTTRALKQEAKGEEVDAALSTRVRETQDLITAFEEMRKQVRVRQSHLDHLAHHDGLTGLPNRLLFRDRLKHAVTLARRGNSMLAVMFLDLDRFKQINDSLGHAAGDKLLKKAAARLQALMRESDTIARLGGDEFAILAEGIQQRGEITRLAEKIITTLEEDFVIDQRQLHISTSIGITLCPEDDTDPDGLIRNADTAMYEAKRSGKGRFHFFTAEMTRQATEYLELETALRQAVNQRAFELHFQPITDGANDELHGCEALLRWQHPEKGYVSPEIFIPVLDDMGRMREVSQWILEEIDRQQQRCLEAGYGPLTISVNLTARLLHDEAFSRHLLRCLQESRPDPHNLIVEITEDSLTQDLEAAERVLDQLKKLGVRIALDDFGTGQSSLNHLRRYPFDLVKIEREFVRDIPHDPNDVDLVHAIIQLSHAFDMEVVAEGVENGAQQELLQAMSCDHLQGYLISRPMPPAALMQFLAGQQDEAAATSRA